MIVVRFKVTCKPEMIEKAKAAFEAVVAPSRKIEGVINFDIAQDITDPNSLIATEVFDDRAALERQEALPEVKNIIDQLPEFLAPSPRRLFTTSPHRSRGEDERASLGGYRS